LDPLPRKKILTVAELTAALRSEIEETFGEVWVAGEVTNSKMASSGHFYFTLKDQTAQIKAILFRSYGPRFRFIPKEGESVLVRGHLTVYEPRGEYQIIVDYIEPKGIGALMAAFEALKERLRAEGLFDEARKKPIPVFPRVVVLITSPTGAVLQDFCRIIRERHFPVQVWVAPVPVQGEKAARAIAQAIMKINRTSRAGEYPLPVDLLIIARGGGSLEDLWAFNEEVVARAIVQSEIPVITAIGHETDTTIADFVSDLRVPTPSVAAEIIAKEGEKQIERFHLAKDRLKESMSETLCQYRQTFRTTTRRLTGPTQKIALVRTLLAQYRLRQGLSMRRQIDRSRSLWILQKQRLDGQHHRHQLAVLKQRGGSLRERLAAMGTGLIIHRRNLLQIAMGRLDLLSPLRILERGYSITSTLDGAALRNSTEVALEEEVTIRLHRGGLRCVIKEKEEL
jgi:exodeoxyribonuclease VII large subunit